MGKASSRKSSDRIHYYHGGYPGLIFGSQILPYAKTSITLRGGYAEFHPERIFVTTSLDLATAYALSFARSAPAKAVAYSGPALGSVYKLRVKGPKTPDEDFSQLALSRGHFSYFVLDAPEIIQVVEANLAPDPPREYRLFAPYETWDSPDGLIYPMWTPSGYMMPNAMDTKRGVTWQRIEQAYGMGPFPGKDLLIQKGFYKN